MVSNMINFAVGPVQSSETIRKIGFEQVPYFRTPEFSKIMLENEELVKEFANAPKGSRTLFLTCSGTGSMEASVINVLNKSDKVLVINGGSFGQRFVDILKIHNFDYFELKLEHGHSLKRNHLDKYCNMDITAVLVNIHETSTGVLYDINLLSDFCKNNNCLLIVDAISSFLADPLNMELNGIDVLITGSQKALACPPGVSLIVLSPNAIERVNNNNPNSLYFDLKVALSNGERGQTPFTPAVGILLQINKRLNEIKNAGGVNAEIKRISTLAHYFRSKIKELPFEIVSESMSNAVTPLHPLNTSAYNVFNILKDEYGIWVCPNGGDMKELIFRVGHIGDLTKEDYDILIRSLEDMEKRKLL